VNLKKIGILVIVLLGLLVLIRLVDRHESRRLDIEGRLLDLKPERIDKIELIRGAEKFIFLKLGNGWNLDFPLKSRADKWAIQGILDDFCQLKYDRQVEINAPDLKKYGLDVPEIELKLFENRDLESSVSVLIGIQNQMDSTSYVKLGLDNRVVLIAAYKRDQLDKKLFDFRDKTIFMFEPALARELEIKTRGTRFFLEKQKSGWFLKQPVFSLAADTVVSTILSAASGLEAIAFSKLASAASLQAFGFDRPLLELKLKTGNETRVLKVVRQDDRFFAHTPGFAEISEIDKKFTDHFDKKVKDFREPRVARFFAFDVSEIIYKTRGLDCHFQRNPEHRWIRVKPVGPGKLDGDRINDLLTALENLEAREFLDHPSGKEIFTYSLELKLGEQTQAGKSIDIGLWISDLTGDSLLVRNRNLPYLFRVSKAFIDRLPRKLEDFIKKTE